MSHFTRIKTRMVEKQFVLSALTDLGYKPEEGGEVRGYAFQKTPAEFKISSPNSKYDIGFVKNDEGYELVADWYGIHNLNQAEFMQKLTQRYAYHATREKLAEQGFTLIAEENQADGRVHMVVRRMA